MLHPCPPLDRLGCLLDGIYLIRADYHDVNTEPGQLGGRDPVGITVEQSLAEEGHNVNIHVVVNRIELLQELAADGLDVMSVNLERREE